jgi:carboxymethylenebutenolidase
MKYSLLSILAFLIITFSSSAQKPSCCSPSSTQQFTAMVQEKNFISAHDAPLPFQYESKKGKNISFKTEGGINAMGYEVKGEAPSNNVVLMFHEWWGLNDYIRQEAEKLQAELGNATVIAVDMFDGRVTNNAKEASLQVQGLKENRASAIIKGAIDYAGPKARLLTIGWCFGGGIALQAAIAAKSQCSGCVMYYGMPETNLEKLKDLKAPVFGIFGTKDKFITPSTVDQFAKKMSFLGKKLSIKNYEADHAFANPSNPHHDAKATADAHILALDFMKHSLR